MIISDRVIYCYSGNAVVSDYFQSNGAWSAGYAPSSTSAGNDNDFSFGRVLERKFSAACASSTGVFHHTGLDGPV